MRRSDAQLDGRVWMAVRTTGIYCLPSCRVRPPRRENVRFFASPEEAERQGFRPCRRCRPEVHGGRPALERARLRRWLAELAGADAPITQLARANGTSPSQVYRLFRRHLGCGPRQARAEARLRRACQLLRSGQVSITEAAYSAGFGRLATFYRWFRREVGMAPRAYRQQAISRRGGHT